MVIILTTGPVSNKIEVKAELICQSSEGQTPTCFTVYAVTEVDTDIQQQMCSLKLAVIIHYCHYFHPIQPTEQMLKLSKANRVMSEVLSIDGCEGLSFFSKIHPLGLPFHQNTHLPKPIMLSVNPITGLQNGWFRNQWVTSQRIYTQSQATLSLISS